MASEDVVNTLDLRYTEIKVKYLTLKEIIRVNGGRLIVSTLPEHPPLYCKWGNDECPELATHFVILVSFDGEDFVNQLCDTHYEYSKENIFNLPTDKQH